MPDGATCRAVERSVPCVALATLRARMPRVTTKPVKGEPMRMIGNRMRMPRASGDVVNQLLGAMREIVTDYGALKRTNDQIGTIIQGTAVFPGGSGLWRGDMPFGALPEDFPDQPVMFVAHNFDKDASYQQSLARGIERMTDEFWKNLRAYIHGASLREEQCFFTNALMGLQSMKATGPMNASTLFRQQCRAFMQRQIEIVNPRCIAILGADAAQELRQVHIAVAHDQLLHPSALRYKKRELRATIIEEQAVKLQLLYGRTDGVV